MMVHIDFDRFNTESEFLVWLSTPEGIHVFEYVYEVLVSNYGKPVRHIPVISKKWDDSIVYSIDMRNIDGFCNRAIKVFEHMEDYEKCAKLLEILNDIRK